MYHHQIIGIKNVRFEVVIQVWLKVQVIWYVVLCWRHYCHSKHPKLLAQWHCHISQDLIFIKNAAVRILYVLAFRNSLVLIGPMHEASQIQWEIYQGDIPSFIPIDIWIIRCLGNSFFVLFWESRFSHQWSLRLQSLGMWWNVIQTLTECLSKNIAHENPWTNSPLYRISIYGHPPYTATDYSEQTVAQCWGMKLCMLGTHLPDYMADNSQCPLEFHVSHQWSMEKNCSWTGNYHWIRTIAFHSPALHSSNCLKQSCVTDRIFPLYHLNPPWMCRNCIPPKCQTF